MADGPVIVWFRQDLRLDDNPALSAAAASGRPVVPLYIHDEETPGAWAPGGAARWWLHHSLAALGASLERLGAILHLERGSAADVLPRLAKRIGAGAVFWNRCYEPHAVARDTKLKASLIKQGLDVESFNASLLFEPWEMKTKGGEPYRVFTPFWNACLARGEVPPPRPAPKSLKTLTGLPDGMRLSKFGLLPSKPNWAEAFPAHWAPGEAGAKRRLGSFLNEILQDYGEARDRPGTEGTSRLSPHLHWGEIGPRQIRAAMDERGFADARTRAGKAAAKFLSELGWREFSYHLLFHFSDLPNANFRAAFDSFPWRRDTKALKAWQRGATGYPIVDAGMRELWATGWMHNRVRMIVASFLTKHLLIDWRQGALWFWDTLVDADLASNAASWQWVAGCGADAAPYFRIFNPVLQGEKFDPECRYVRRWVPELAKLPDGVLHKPWEASGAALKEAGVALGKTYPKPIVDRKAARARALAAYDKIKGAA
jgi:deoxyribodipyrimidine photo-lyase